MQVHDTKGRPIRCEALGCNEDDWSRIVDESEPGEAALIMYCKTCGLSSELRDEKVKAYLQIHRIE